MGRQSGSHGQSHERLLFVGFIAATHLGEILYRSMALGKARFSHPAFT